MITGVVSIFTSRSFTPPENRYGYAINADPATIKEDGGEVFFHKGYLRFRLYFYYSFISLIHTAKNGNRRHISKHFLFYLNPDTEFLKIYNRLKQQLNYASGSTCTTGQS
jgi:hypothetical protein